MRALTEALAAPLSPEDQVVQSMPDVSPTKWHRAHTTWFFETFVLSPELAGYASSDPGVRVPLQLVLRSRSARVIRDRSAACSRARRSTRSRATARHVDAAMRRAHRRLRRRHVRRIARIVELGLHHEQQHQELLLMDIKHVLSLQPARPRLRDRAARAAPRDSAAR